MPSVNHRDVLAATYAAVRKKIQAGEMPTVLLQAGTTLFTNINPNQQWTWLPKPKRVTFVSKFDANRLLLPRDGHKERQNRFSGPSLHREIPGAGGLYCVLQQQALVNERIHYSGRPGTVSLCGRCVLRIRLMGALLVAELSPHNPQALAFLRELGADTWKQMNDPDDCSVARGIGLAVAHSGFLRGLSVQTVRMSDRSAEERGDNLVLFGEQNEPIPGLYIEEATYFNRASPPKQEVFPVIFPGLAAK
jgi:hypothetical protein